MSLRDDLVSWLRSHPELPASVPIDIAPVELEESRLRAVGITLPPSRPSREYFGRSVLEQDLVIYLVARAEADPPDTADADRASIASMEPALSGLHGFSGPLGRAADGSKVADSAKVLSCVLEDTAITSDDDLRTVTATFDYAMLVQAP